MSFKALENRVDQEIRVQVKKKVDAALNSLYGELGAGTSSGGRYFTEYAALTKRLQEIGCEILFEQAKNKLWSDLQKDAIEKVRVAINGK